MNRANLTEAVRRRLVRYPPPLDHHYGVHPPPPPLDPMDLGPFLPLVRTAQGRLDQLAALGERHGDWISSRVLASREAVTSSEMEGTHSSTQEVLEAWADEGDTPARTERHQVRAYALVLKNHIALARDRGPGLFTRDLIMGLHHALMAEDPDFTDPPGEPRRKTVWIGGRDIAYSTWNPPPADLVPECLEACLAHMRADGMWSISQGLVTRLAIAHAHFEAIHPFSDGNGRVGRLLLPLMLAAEGHLPLFLSPYISHHKGRYGEALKAAQQRLDWPTMAGFMAEAIIGAADELETTLTALGDLVDHWKGRKPGRKGSAALLALDILPRRPVMSINQLGADLEVSFPAASKAVETLLAAGILVEITGQRRNRLFLAPEVLSITERPFGHAPRPPGSDRTP